MYAYDHTGNMGKVSTYGSDGALSGRTVFVYDQVGNWIKKPTENIVSHFGKSSLEPVEEVIRTIKYY